MVMYFKGHIVDESKDNRIQYMVQVGNDEIIEIQRNASFFVNPSQ
jgi:hypothetical protein